MRDKEAPGPSGQSAILAADRLAPSEANWGISQFLLRVRLGRSGSDPEGRKVKKQRKGCR